MIAPEPNFEHLARLSDRQGTFEHAELTVPRREHGYCTDDMARVLVVIAREPDPGPSARNLGRTALQFLASAQGEAGDCRDRMTAEGDWEGPYGTDDSWGRGLWAFGTAARRAHDHRARAVALILFERGAVARSRWPRSMAFAALGAAEVLEIHPRHELALELVRDAAEVIGRPRDDAGWPWPERALSYANAVLPDAMIAAGEALRRPELVADGLHLLRWLLDRETVNEHLSVTPVAGSSRRRHRPGFDQQPIEAASLADACVRASVVSGDDGWDVGLRLAVGWFLGENDVGIPMVDPVSHGGFDGLCEHGPNLNQGAESTLALLSTLQHARGLVPVPA